MVRYLIPVACISLAAGMVLVVRPKFQSSSNEQRQAGDSSNHETASFRDEETPSTIRTKSKERVIHRKPTLEETNDLLRNTIIPRVDFEDLSVGESAKRLRLLIHEAGIEPHELTVICSPSISTTSFKIKELKLRNVPLGIALKYICDSTILRYRVTPGVVEFSLQSYYGLNSDSVLQKSKNEMNLQGDSSDPFSFPRSKEPDPFAEH